MSEVELLEMTNNEFDTYFIEAIERYASELSKNKRFPDINAAYKFAQ